MGILLFAINNTASKVLYNLDLIQVRLSGIALDIRTIL